MVSTPSLALSWSGVMLNPVALALELSAAMVMLTGSPMRV